MRRRKRVTINEQGRLKVADGRAVRVVDWCEVQRVNGSCWPHVIHELFLILTLADRRNFAIGEWDPHFNQVAAAVNRHFALPNGWYLKAEAGPVVLWDRRGEP